MTNVMFMAALIVFLVVLKRETDRSNRGALATNVLMRLWCSEAGRLSYLLLAVLSGAALLTFAIGTGASADMTVLGPALRTTAIVLDVVAVASLAFSFALRPGTGGPPPT